MFAVKQKWLSEGTELKIRGDREGVVCYENFVALFREWKAAANREETDS